MTINAIGSTPTSWPVGSGERPHRHDHTKMLEPAAKALGMSTDDLETQLQRKPGEGRGPGSDPSALTEKLMWSATSAIGQSTPSDSEGDAPLVDEYA
jgi:hypothetical protein